ncbi:division plane positioning ATPase MipZ (plasmid) [Paracoccus sp. T5]
MYSTKGGVGKSTTILSIVNAIASANRGSESPESVCVIDADHKQGSLAGFFDERRKRGLPDHSIECRVIEPSDDTPELLYELGEKYDHVIIDLPGQHANYVVLSALQADLVLMPAAMTLVEVNPVRLAMKNMMQIIREHSLPTKVGFVVSRGARIYQFEGRTAKGILRSVQRARFPILKTPLSNQGTAMTDAWATGHYHFELIELDPKAKSSVNAHEDAVMFWDDCKTYNIVEMPAEDDEESEVTDATAGA